MSNQSEGPSIRLDYYVGAYGPTLRINANTHDALALIRDIFKAMATRATSEVQISNGPRFRLSGFSFLKLRVGETGDQKHLRNVGSPQGEGFVWELDPHGWRDCRALLGGLFQHGAGHQYLSREGVDDALVELVYGESTVPVA